MKDAYEVLGVSKNSSMDEIKKAYRSLVKRYHPDKYQNNPLADLAQEKLQEINEAYDYLEKNHGNSAYSQVPSGFGNANRNEDAGMKGIYNDIRVRLDRNDLANAERRLIGIGITDRDAEWNFLYGMLCYKKGRYDEALSYVKRAMAMDSNNFEYQRMYSSMTNRNNVYRSYGGGTNVGDPMCEAMKCYCCADLLCPCF
ncbi:MAG: DnaJ domain-containing protein [Clostridiales bacterium]|nr:DnaJ domain-containing protein [Clostridiales bacterium]